MQTKQLPLFDSLKEPSPAPPTVPEPAPTAVGEDGARPILKWAGGKRKLAKTFLPHLRLGGRRLVEPFVGSAAVSLALYRDARSLWLSDVNADLINLYRCVRDETAALLAEVENLFFAANNADTAYYALRSEFNGAKGTVRSAALFVYLNRHGYNGLCRYNASGGFNVPFGKYTNPQPPLDEIRVAAQALHFAELTCGGFAEVLEKCGAGDAVYCDPPYVALSETANFTKYAVDDFTAASQQALVEAAKAAAGRGAVVVISNHDTEEARGLYRDAQLHFVDVRRSISQKAETRGMVRELIAVYG